MAGFARDPRQPIDQMGKSAELEFPLLRHMGVGVEGEIGDGGALADEIAPLRKMALHQGQRLVAVLHPAIDFVGAQIPAALHEVQPPTRRGDRRFVVVLLEEHPAQNFGAIEPVFGQKRRAFGQKTRIAFDSPR